MSFQSGWNAGLNLAANIRSNAARDREMDMQAKRDEVNKRATEQLIEQRATKMKQEDAVFERMETDRVESETVLGYFASEAGKLKFSSPEDVTTYRDLVGYSLSNIKDQDVLNRFSQINDMFQQKYAYKRQIDKTIKAEEKSVYYEKHSDDMYQKTGIEVDPDTPQGRSQIDGFIRWEAAYDALKKAGKTWEDAGVNGSTRNISSDNFAKINTFLMETGKQQAILDNMTDQQKNAKAIGEKREQLPADASLSDQIKITSGGNELKISEHEAIGQAFMALELAVSAEKQMSNLGIPFQGSAFTSWFADLKRNAAAFSNQTSDNLDAFRSTITQLVPVLARGIFQETGVLTEADVKLYSGTIATIENTPKSNERVMAATQSLIARITRNHLKRAIDGGMDVSRYASEASKLKNVPTQAYWLKDKMSEGEVNNAVLSGIYEDLVVNEVIFPGETVKYWANGSWKMNIVPEKSFFGNVNAAN